MAASDGLFTDENFRTLEERPRDDHHDEEANEAGEQCALKETEQHYGDADQHGAESGNGVGDSVHFVGLSLCC